MATVFRPRSGRENLEYFADLQRQAAERIAPLRTRQRRRSRARVRRVGLRLVMVLVPALLALLVAVDAGGSRAWLNDTWQALTRSADGGQALAPATVHRA